MPRPRLPAGLGKFYGSTVGSAAGFAAGGAISRALNPTLQQITNESWRLNLFKPLDAITLAAGVSQGQVPYAWARTEAERTGISNERFDHLVDIANVGPGVAQAFNLWRRYQIQEPGFRRALKRQGLEDEWIDDLWEVRWEILDPAQLAAAIHRGLIPDPGLLKGEQPSGPRRVEQYPVYPINALEEAHGSGYDRDRLGVLVGLQGLPMGPVQAAQAFFKGILTHGDYIAAFNESNQRNEWAQAYLDDARQIPTARDFIENALRGYRTFDEAVAGAQLHGMSREHAALIFQNSGRAMNLHQITQALAYGAHYKPTPDDDPDPYRQSTLVGPLRPEYYELNEALKYLLPTPMYFRTLQTQGVLKRDEAAMWYKRLGWPPELAEQVADAFAKKKTGPDKDATASDLLTLYQGGRRTLAETIAALEDLGYDAEEAQAKVDVLDARRVVTERTRVITAAHKAFIKGTLPPDQVKPLLGDLGVAEWAADTILSTWITQKVYELE